jgi:hypothetical protein
LREKRSLGRRIFSERILVLFALWLLPTVNALSQSSVAPADNKTEVKQLPQREVIIEGLASYGNYQLFASESDTKIYTAGVEYDRNSWGYGLGARLDYVAEILPVVILNEPADTNYFGDPISPLSPKRKLLYGIGFSPIGLRMMWFDKRAVKPYMVFKGGLLVFDHKAISSHASYENFSMQSGLGVQTRLTHRLDLRLGLWGDFHFSDGFDVPVNPGSDMMNASLAISYHLAARDAPSGPRHWLPRL